MKQDSNQAKVSRKPLIFLSHDSRDAQLAAAFSDLLAKVSTGLLKSFCSSDRKGSQGIPYGAEWYQEVLRNLERATDVVCILTARSMDRPWVLYEAGFARGKANTPVHGFVCGIPLKTASTGPFAQLQLCADDDDSVTTLLLQLLGRIPEAAPRRELVLREVRGFKAAIKKLQGERRPSRQTKNTAAAAAAELRPTALAEVIRDWRRPTAGTPSLFIVVGGSEKYDHERTALQLKPYQSTEPVRGVVQIARALFETKSDRIVEAYCDYAKAVRERSQNLDLVLVGGADTNRIVKEIFERDSGLLPVRFHPPSSSEQIVAPHGKQWFHATEGLILALERPLSNVRYAVLCAGNGAQGTNAALSWLASAIREKPSVIDSMIGSSNAAVVEADESAGSRLLWPDPTDATGT